RAISAPRSAHTPAAAAGSAAAEMVAQAAARRPVGNFVSRVLVAAAGLPLVLGLVWLGGWWLFVLVLTAGLVALHEFYWMTRPLRPVVIAGYAGLALFRRHRLAPRISPGKTWEGFFAGALATVAATFFALYKDRHDFLTVGHAVVLGVAIAIAAPLGDLFESLLKRDMQVKDSGRLL